MTRNKSGFTLIELLIVIAIIAILALIAIPNFLEAQTRSKVSRAMADMRSLATAIEAYMVDHNTYPPSCCPLATMPKSSGTTLVDPITTWPNYARLTTPVSYLTSIPIDPFSQRADCWTGRGSQGPCHYYSGPWVTTIDTATFLSIPRQIWLLVSLGPNNALDMRVDTTDWDAYALYDVTVANTGGGANDGYMYDPSNGTISKGDIYRFKDKPFPKFLQ